MRQSSCLRHLAVLGLSVLLAAPWRDAFAQAPPEKPALADQPAPAEIPAVVLDGAVGAALLGKPVQSARSEDLGRVVHIVVDRNGSMRAAVIDFGGFLGVGTRKIAVDWRVLHFPDKGNLDRLIADLPRDQLKIAPPYKEGEPIVVIGGPQAPPAEGVAPAPKS
jgi:hypothetical protein